MILSYSQTEKPNKDFDLNNTELINKRENPCFDDSNLDPNYCDDVNKDDFNLTLDAYSGCTFVVSFHYVQCNFSGDKRLIMDDFELISHDCPQYNADVDAARLNGTLSEFTLDFEQMIWDEITLIALNGIGSTFGNAPVINYYYNSCTNYCYFTGLKSNFYYYYYTKTGCGDGCCSVYAYWVLDANGWTLSGETENNPYPLICDDTQYVSNCAPGSVFNTACTYTCDIFLHD